MEYEYGKDIIARHMYSLNNSAAVCQDMSEFPTTLRYLVKEYDIELLPPMVVFMIFRGCLEMLVDVGKKGSNHLLPTTCPVLDGIGCLQFQLPAYRQVCVRV